ncbi:MAG: STY4528 family pathogenicity island replication protein [Candidatus Thiodiazotropha endolucinida]|nr:STY4528 family pathogenicity island replication protein [Candidatus Thiodiazotropha endolucinida]
MSDKQPLLRPETYALEILIKAAITRAQSDPDDKSVNTLLFLGDREPMFRTLLMGDSVLNPVDKMVWMALFMGARETRGETDFPSHQELTKQVNVASTSTVARAVAILRITRWLTLCARCRGKNGRYRGNLYALHDEPLPVVDALHLDPGYLTFLSKSCSHYHARVRRVAQQIQDEIETNGSLASAVNGNEHACVAENGTDDPQQDRAKSSNVEAHQDQNLTLVSCSSNYINEIITTVLQHEKVSVDRSKNKPLIYPRRLSTSQRPLADHYLSLIPVDQRQPVLDELEGRFRSEQKGMSPVYDELRFLYRLCQLVLEGGFVPNLGIKVLDERREQHARWLSRQRQQAERDTAAKRSASKSDQDRLAEIRKTLGRKPSPKSTDKTH